MLDDPAAGTTSGNPHGDDPARTGTEVDTTTQTSQQTDTAAGATDDTAPEEVSSGLITAEEYARVKDDPAAFRKAILKGFTQKTQQLAKERGELGTWAEIREAFNEDPATALRVLGAQFGLEIRDPKATSDGGQTATAQAATDAGDDAVAALKGALADAGLDDLAEKLAPAIRKIAEAAAGKATEPIRTHQEQLIEESAAREADATLSSFGEKHPDWKPGNEVDKAMAKLAAQVDIKRDPKTGKALMSDMEYLETLHFLATRDQQIAKGVKEHLDRMTTSAAAAADGKASTVAGDKVTKGPPKNAGFNDAYQAAKRGERWE
ncbi:MAG TPA: hypothetical protein VEA16_06335 [Vicinamibacterales bacterium]|nr:hypothetical protein [Vicinamibacterales bacterium]